MKDVNNSFIPFGTSNLFLIENEVLSHEKGEIVIQPQEDNKIFQNRRVCVTSWNKKTKLAARLPISRISRIVTPLKHPSAKQPNNKLACILLDLST